jgi:hypothetical protein
MAIAGIDAAAKAAAVAAWRWCCHCSHKNNNKQDDGETDERFILFQYSIARNTQYNFLKYTMESGIY